VQVPIVADQASFLHCPVPTAAPALFQHLVQVLSHPGTRSKPSFHGDKGKRLPLFQELGSDSNKDRFLSTAVKSLFVRDPWWRLFLAYVDTAFASSPQVWRQWGRGQIMWRSLKGGQSLQQRPVKAEEGYKQCHKPLSFAEVMRFASRPRKRNYNDFMTATELCQPCQFHYNHVGKMETFTRDLQALAAALDLSMADYFKSQEFRDDYARYVIEEAVRVPWRQKGEFAACGMNATELGRRVWRRLQIHGLIELRHKLPLTEHALKQASENDMVLVALSAYRRSTNMMALQQQKRAAFREAWRTVDVKTVELLRIQFANDFELFAYDPRQPDVYDRNGPLPLTGAFDVWGDWG
jgi:hypothetical protein